MIDLDENKNEELQRENNDLWDFFTMIQDMGEYPRLHNRIIALRKKHNKFTGTHDPRLDET